MIDTTIHHEVKASLPAISRTYPLVEKTTTHSKHSNTLPSQAFIFFKDLTLNTTASPSTAPPHHRHHERHRPRYHQANLQRRRRYFRLLLHRKVAGLEQCHYGRSFGGTPLSADDRSKIETQAAKDDPYQGY